MNIYLVHLYLKRIILHDYGGRIIMNIDLSCLLWFFIIFVKSFM